jgi:predicted acyl esterase
MTHGDDDEYWKQPGYNVEEYWDDRANVPMLLIGAWYDSYARSTCENFVQFTKRGTGPCKLLMDPASFRRPTVFKKGYRIRLDISSSNFPRFDVNPNTGEPIGKNARMAAADQLIYHDPEHPSHIVLPVV